MHSNTKTQSDDYIGLAVLALFAVAIIAGQARGDVNSAYAFDASLPTALELGVLIERDALDGVEAGSEAIRKFRVMPHVVDFGTGILDLSELTFSGNLAPRSARRETVL